MYWFVCLIAIVWLTIRSTDCLLVSSKQVDSRWSNCLIKWWLGWIVVGCTERSDRSKSLFAWWVLVVILFSLFLFTIGMLSVRLAIARWCDVWSVALLTVLFKGLNLFNTSNDVELIVRPPANWYTFKCTICCWPLSLPIIKTKCRRRKKVYWSTL